MKSARTYLYCMVVGVLPATRCFALKNALLRWAGVRVGGRVKIVSSARFYTGGWLEIGDDTWVGHEVLVLGGDAPLFIGANCDIAPRVSFISGTHRVNPQGPHVAGGGYSLPIQVGDGCWICTGATILGGTTIGERSIVAAGAVVKGDFPAGSLIGGVPARVLRDTLSADIGEQA